VTTNDTVDRTNSLIPYATSDGKDYTLPQTTKSLVNGLSTFVTTTSGNTVGSGSAASNVGGFTSTYTVARTGDVYFMVIGGGGGGGEWFGRGPGGGAGGGAYGYFTNLAAGTVLSLTIGGSGTGNGSDGAGSGGQSKIEISSTTLVTANAGAGKPNQSGSGGGGGSASIDTTNVTYPAVSTTVRSGTSGGSAPGDGGQSWFTQDGETTYQWRTNTISQNPGARWTSGTNYGWGDGGGGGGGSNLGGNSGAPGIVFLWQDAYSTTNAGDPYYPSVKCFTGTGVTTNSAGTPTSGISLTSFTGEYTRAEL